MQIDCRSAEDFKHIAHGTVEVVASNRPAHPAIRFSTKQILILKYCELSSPEIEPPPDLTGPANKEAWQRSPDALALQITLGVCIRNVSARFQDEYRKP